MLVLPTQGLSKVFSTLGQDCVSSQPALYRPHIPTVFQWSFLELPSPSTVLTKGERTDFAQDERLGLPCWTMILAICVSVDVSKYLDILTLDFSITMEYQRRKMYCFALFPCFSDHLLYCFCLSSAAMPVSCQVFPFFVHCCLASGVCIA